MKSAGTRPKRWAPPFSSAICMCIDKRNTRVGSLVGSAGQVWRVIIIPVAEASNARQTPRGCMATRDTKSKDYRKTCQSYTFLMPSRFEL
jgi:hypothetical protein